jgi:hypothetical protein
MSEYSHTSAKGIKTVCSRDCFFWVSSYFHLKFAVMVTWGLEGPKRVAQLCGAAMVRIGFGPKNVAIMTIFSISFFVLMC